MYICRLFVFKQKTAYEMRISDWSSDVCSSDLDVQRTDRDGGALMLGNRGREPVGERHAAPLDADEDEPGRTRLLLDDLVGDANDRPADLVRGQDRKRGV